MSLLDWLLRRQPDPTLGWPEGTGVLPALGFAPFRIGTLKFGASVDAARFLGRPTKVWRGKIPGIYGLTYARWGMGLHFEEGQLVEAEFTPAEDVAGQVRVEDGARVSTATSVDQLIQRFGEPTLRTTGEAGEVELQFKDAHNILEFEFNEVGELEYWCAYPLD